MTIKNNIAIKISIVLILISTSLFALPSPCRADVSDSFTFMDLRASIEELQSSISKVRRGIALIIVYDNAGFEIRRGSGFFIDREGRLITNAFTMKNAYSAAVLTKFKFYRKVSILNIQKELDFALLKVNSSDETPLKLDYSHMIKPGERVIAIGKHSGSTVAFTEGIVDKISSIEGTPHLIEIITSKPLTRHRPTKVGPLISINGNVIGITTTKIVSEKRKDEFVWSYENTNLHAISLQSIQPALSQNGTVVELPPARTKIWHLWFVRHLQAKTTLAYVALINFGFPKSLAIVIAAAMFILLAKTIYVKLKARLGR